MLAVPDSVSSRCMNALKNAFSGYQLIHLSMMSNE